MTRAVTDQRSQGIVGTFVAHRMAFNLVMAVPMPPAPLCTHKSMAIAWQRDNAGCTVAPRTAK